MTGRCYRLSRAVKLCGGIADANAGQSCAFHRDRRDWAGLGKVHEAPTEQEDWRETHEEKTLSQFATESF